MREILFDWPFTPLEHGQYSQSIGVSTVRRTVYLDIDGVGRACTADFSVVLYAPLNVETANWASINIEAVLLDVLCDDIPIRIEDLAGRVAREMALSARDNIIDVTICADISLERWTPVSGKRSVEIYRLIAASRVYKHRLISAIGVEVQGMTACPCAQDMLRVQSFEKLRDAGFSENDANRVLNIVPNASHNQRACASLLLRTGDSCLKVVRIADLVDIIENAMSSETYGLLKRPDEFFVVNKAHRATRQPQDVVDEILEATIALYSEFPDDTLVLIRQTDFESIHKHGAFAQAFLTFVHAKRKRPRVATPPREASTGRLPTGI